MRDTVLNKVDKVWRELVQTWIIADGTQGSMAQSHDFFVRIVVENGSLDLVKVQDEFLADNMLDGRVDGDVFVAGEGVEGRVSARSLGQEVLRSCFGRGRVLWDRWLDAFDGKPMCWTTLA